MKIKFLRSYNYAGDSYSKGQIADLDDGAARSIVAAGNAEAVESRKAEAAAFAGASEKADIPSVRKRAR